MGIGLRNIRKRRHRRTLTMTYFSCSSKGKRATLFNVQEHGVKLQETYSNLTQPSENNSCKKKKLDISLNT